MRWIVVVGGDRVLVDLRSDVARVNLLALLEKARGMHAPHCPDHPTRPPIRHRAAIAGAWLEISLHEGHHRP